MDNKQVVTLLRKSKDNLVAAFEDAGVKFDGTAKAADFGGIISGLGGLRDVSIACIRKSDGKKLYLNKDEYGSMSNKVAVRGIRLRARGMSFIVAMGDIGLTNTYVLQSKAVQELHTNKSRAAAFTDTDGLQNTAELREAVADGVVESAAITALDSYTAFTTDEYSGGDTATWYIPAAAQMMLISRYADEIADIATAVSASAASYKPIGNNYWTSTWNTYQYPFFTGKSTGLALTGVLCTQAFRIRPICNE